jgi:plastocyanin
VLVCSLARLPAVYAMHECVYASKQASMFAGAVDAHISINYVHHGLNTDHGITSLDTQMKKQKQRAKPRLTKNRVIAYGAVAAVIAIVGFFGYRALMPANANSPVLAFPQNDYIKATHTKTGGFYFLSQTSGAVKGIRTAGGNSGVQINPNYTYSKGELVSFHFINEDYDTHSQHNFNIDEFNIHTKDLNYFGSETVNFVADKAGTFNYYCSIHPEMKGTITVEGG